MKKRLIFDVDNTIIMWKEKYKEAIKETLELYNIDIDYNKVDSKIEAFEDYYNIYSKENMLDLINKSFNLNLSIDFINTWLDKLASITEYDENVYDTLNYLSKKYDLVILSNWIKENQIERLKKANIYEFFSDLYCGDEFLKPNKEAYIASFGKFLVSELVIVGDDFKKDIQVPLELGISAIYVTNTSDENNDKIKKDLLSKNIKNIENLCVISNVNKLKEIL